MLDPALIDSLYGGALDASRWAGALDRILEVTGASCARVELGRAGSAPSQKRSLGESRITVRRGARRAVCTLRGAVRDDDDCAEALAHLRRALALALRIAELRELEARSSAASCDLSEGVIIADGGGHVLAADALARGLLAGATEIPLRDLLGCPSEPGAGGRAFARGSAHSNPLPGPAFVLRVADLRRAAALPVEVLGRRYAFTASEASIATHLASGETIAELSRALGISLASARTQLRSVFAKTGTHRQAELVALFDRNPGILRQ
jgi:DNA-binding CsgD family transcriptional regulator